MVYTLVEPGSAMRCASSAAASACHYCDLLGHPIDSISRVAGVAARMEPGARAPLDQTYFKRIEAMEFAVRYDDGVGGGLDEADIVLVGVSRTSKTPLSIYLGYLGHKAANVPIVKGVEPPPPVRDRPVQDRRLTIDAGAPRRDPAGPRPLDGRPATRYADLEACSRSSTRRPRSTGGSRCP
jgi:regulator of PEP synthase PpsR (kinase-PPPase family)